MDSDILAFLRRQFLSRDSDCHGDRGCAQATQTLPRVPAETAKATATKDGASELSTSGAEKSTSSATMEGLLTVTAEPTATTTSDSSLSTTSSTSATTTGSTSATGIQSSGGGGTSTKTKLAIAIPVAVVGALIILGIIFFVLRRRRQQQQQQPAPNPYEETARNESKAISTSQLMVTVPVSQQNNQREPGFPRFPMLDVPESRDGDISPAESAGHMSQNEAHSEVGYGMAVSGDQRPNATEQDRVISRSASPANALEAHVQGQRAEHDDAVSVVSDLQEQGGTREQHYDDLSSVSSFDGDTPRADDHQHPFR